MRFSAGTCESCGTPARERVETVTGRLFCQRCFDDVQRSAAAAIMTGGGIGRAIAIHGWLRLVRQCLPGR